MAYVSYEDDQVWRIQPVDYEKTITLHKSNPRNERFLHGRGLKVHDEVEYDRGSLAASASAMDDVSTTTVTLVEVPLGTIRKTCPPACQLLQGVVARIANDKFGFINFHSPPHAMGDIFFQLGGCVNAYQTFDQLRPGVEVSCLVVDSMNQPDKQVAVYVHTTGRILDPPIGSGPHANSSALANKNPHREPLRRADSARSVGSDLDRRPYSGSPSRPPPHEEELFGWVVYLGRDEGSFRSVHSHMEHKFSLVSDAIAGERPPTDPSAPVQLPVPVGWYPGIRVGDEVSCRLYVPPPGTSNPSKDNIPIVYQLERLSSRDPPLNKSKTWSYGRLATLDDVTGRGVVIDDDAHAGERVELQRNLMCDRSTLLRNLRERDPVIYLRMTYKTRLGRTRTVAVLVQEDSTGGVRNVMPARSPAVVRRYREPPSPEERATPTPRDLFDAPPLRSPVLPPTSPHSPPNSLASSNAPLASNRRFEGWITSLQDSFGILRLSGNQKTHFFHFKQAMRFEDLSKFDSVTCLLKVDGTATQVEKLSRPLPMTPPDWRRAEIIELGPEPLPSASSASTSSNGGGAGLLRDLETGETHEFKVHAIKCRHSLRLRDRVLFMFVDSPKHGNNFVAIVDSMDSESDSPPDSKKSFAKGVQEGWVTSLQDSFGILRLMGDRETHFFHIKSCLSNFAELRNGDCVRCTLKPDGTAQHVEKLTYTLPLDPPDWLAGRVDDMDDTGSGKLTDRETQKVYDYKGSVLKGNIQQGDYVLFLVVDSPKYGNDFVAAVVPDRTISASSTPPAASTTNKQPVESDSADEDVDLFGWVVSLKSDKGLLRAMDDVGEWEFDLSDAYPDIKVGDEVSCRRDAGPDYRVIGLTRLVDKLERLCWKQGKIGSVKEEYGYLIDSETSASIPIQRNQLLKEHWVDGEAVTFLPMNTEDGDIAALVEQLRNKRERSSSPSDRTSKSARQG